jgi:hypothetical protein
MPRQVLEYDALHAMTDADFYQLTQVTSEIVHKLIFKE